MNGEPLHHWKKEILAAGHFHTGYILKSKRWAARQMLTPSVGKKKQWLIQSRYTNSLLGFEHTSNLRAGRSRLIGMGCKYCLEDTKESRQILERSVGLGILMVNHPFAVINLARVGHVFPALIFFGVFIVSREVAHSIAPQRPPLDEAAMAGVWTLTVRFKSGYR